MAEVSGSSLALTIITVILGSGLVSSVATALVNANSTKQTTTATTDQKNVELVLKVHEDDDAAGMPEKGATYAALMAEAGLIDPSFACSLVGFAIYEKGDAALTVIKSVRASLDPAFIEKNFAKQPCDAQHFGDIDQSTVKGDAASTQPTESFVCPGGVLYTQFGSAEQGTFGTTLRLDVNQSLGGTPVTQPQIIAKYNADSVVVRYFFQSQEDEARRWQLAIESAVGHAVDVKYAYVPGYETAIGAARKATYELWWPAGIKTPATVVPVQCTKQPTT